MSQLSSDRREWTCRYRCVHPAPSTLTVFCFVYWHYLLSLENNIFCYWCCLPIKSQEVVTCLHAYKMLFLHFLFFAKHFETLKPNAKKGNITENCVTIIGHLYSLQLSLKQPGWEPTPPCQWTWISAGKMLDCSSSIIPESCSQVMETYSVRWTSGLVQHQQ